MSGLELAAGVIAVVQVTGQAAVLITKIKKLWGGVRDAPEDIKDLVDEIELTSLLLQDMERQLIDSGAPVEAWDSPTLRIVFQYTRRAHLALQDAAELLEGEIQRSQSKSRRFIASAKAVLRKRVLDRLKAKLEFSLKLLQLSTQLQTSAAVARATSVIFERLPEPPLNVPSAVPTEDDSTSDKSPETQDPNIQDPNTHATCHEITSPHFRSKGFNALRARDWTWTGRFHFRFTSREECWLSIQPPSWLARTTHLILANKSVAGPQLALRRYETIASWDTEVNTIIARDDWPALEMYLNTTGISPFAVNPGGSSLLWLACIYRSIKVVEALLQVGLEVLSEVIEEYDDASGLLIEKWQKRTLHDPATTATPLDVVTGLRILKMLRAHGFAGTSGNVHLLMVAMKTMAIEYLPRYLELFMPMQQDLPSGVTFQMVCHLLLQYRHNDISILLPELRTPSPIVDESSCILGSSLMHFLVFAIGRQSTNIPLSSCIKPQLQPLLRWIVRCAEMDPKSLHRRLSREQWRAAPGHTSFRIRCLRHITPMWRLIANMILESMTVYTRGLGFEVEMGRSHYVFHLFLASLRDAGHDLKRFGRKERRLSKNGVALCGAAVGLLKLCFSGIPNKTLRWTRLRVLGMTFGCRVEDWVIWWAWEYEHCAKEFWDMVESPLCHVPGSWVDPEYNCEMESLREYCELDDQTSFIWSEV